MPKLLLNIPDLAKAQEFLAHFVPNLAFIEEAEILEDTEEAPENKEKKALLYEEKDTYTVEDLESIVAEFPPDYAWTYSDLEKYFPQNLPIKVEIIDNQIFIMPTPNFYHQKISMKLSREMSFYAEKYELGEVLTAPMDTKLDENNTVQPDILFIAISRYPIIEKNYINGSPDMVVEIWSPGNSPQERERKHNLYEGKAVTEYWQIEPSEKSVLVEILGEESKYEVFSQAIQTGKIRSKVLEGFEIELEELFKGQVE